MPEMENSTFPGWNTMSFKDWLSNFDIEISDLNLTPKQLEKSESYFNNIKKLPNPHIQEHLLSSMLVTLRNRLTKGKTGTQRNQDTGR